MKCFTFTLLLLLHLAHAQAQTISCPANVTVNTDPGYCSAVVRQIDPVVSPAGTLVIYHISSPLTNETGSGTVSGKAFLSGVNTVTYSLQYNASVSCSFTVTVLDREPPVLSCPANLTLNCAKDVPYMVLATARDNCTPERLIDVKYLGEEKTSTCLNQYVLTRNFKATDAAGNTSTAAQLITVYDKEPPLFIQPPPVSPLKFSCASAVPAADATYYTAFDECDENDDLPVEYKEVKTPGSCANSFTLTRTWTAKDACCNAKVYTQVIVVEDKEAPEFTTPAPTPVTYLNCASEIPAASEQRATDCNESVPVQLTEVKSEEQCANRFKLTRTWTATDLCGNTAVRTQVFIINDRQAPVFDGLPPGISNVSCAKDIPAALVQTATDNCGGTPVISYSEAKTNVQCANRFTLTRTWTATDACGNTATRSQVFNVYDDQPPKLYGISASKAALWPPNHKMQEVTIDYTATDNCSVTSTLTVTSSEPVKGGSDGDQSPDWEVIDGHHLRLRAEKANNGEARIYTIHITVTDGCHPPVDSTITVVVAHNINSPQTGNAFKVGSTISFDGAFWDRAGKTHTAKWLVDGSSVSNGSVTEPAGLQNGKATGSYKFNNPGVYKLQLNITDQAGLTSYVNTQNDLDAIVVVFDPNGGNAYGGGWFTSPTGALRSDASATGKASFGFSVNYANAARPKGETQFEFKVGAFEFNALNFDYLAIGGSKAQFRGTGKIIGGQSGIGFIMTVADGELDGSGLDKIRMKIFNRNTGQVYYDNQPGAVDADDPLTVVGGNSQVVIQGPPVTSVTTASEVPAEVLPASKLELKAYPNPSRQAFTIKLKSPDLHTRVLVQVVDEQGREVERRTVPAGSAVVLGAAYLPGVYFLSASQGAQQASLKLVKEN